MEVTSRHGLNVAVCGDCPALCAANLARRLSVKTDIGFFGMTNAFEEIAYFIQAALARLRSSSFDGQPSPFAADWLAGGWLAGRRREAAGGAEGI